MRTEGQKAKGQELGGEEVREQETYIKAVQKTEKEAEAAFISHQSILLATIVLYLGTIVNI